MSRPSFALSCLLLVFSGSLLLVSTARSEQLLDGRIGGVRPDVCPLLDHEIYDAGFGLHFGERCFGLVPQLPTLAKRPAPAPARRPTLSDPPCSVADWYGPCAACPLYEDPVPARDFRPVRNPSSQPSYASGHDPVYDRVVYGVKSSETRRLVTEGWVALSVQPAAVVQHASQRLAPWDDDDWDGWDWCEEACHDVASAPAGRKASPIGDGRALHAEPSSVDAYYATFGGLQIPLQVRRVATPDPLLKLLRSRARHVVTSSYWDYLYCHAVSAGYTVSARLNAARTDVRAWWLTFRQVPSTPTIEWPHKSSSLSSTSLDSLSRVSMLAVANSLDRAGTVLQNASRHLKHLVENHPVEVSAKRDPESAR